MDDASNASLGSQSASTKDKSQPLLTPDNNTPFNDDNVALAASLGDNMALAGGQEVNTPFDNNVAPPRRQDHPMASDGGLGDDPLHATQARLVDPRVAPAATINPDEIFCCLCQILTKLDNKVNASSLTTSIQQTITNSIKQALNGYIQ